MKKNGVIEVVCKETDTKLFELFGLRRSAGNGSEPGTKLLHPAPTAEIALYVLNIAGGAAACYGRVGSFPDFDLHQFAYDGDRLIIVQESILNRASTGQTDCSFAIDFYGVLDRAMAKVKPCCMPEDGNGTN